MVEYEVTITVEKEIFDDYMVWLKEHISEMLKLEGFKDASFYHVDVLNSQVICVRYEVESRELLEGYIKNQAQRMRAQSNQNFVGKYSISRRILFKGDI